jgi:tetratricopeptide (TPR) repeat protein
MALLKVFNPHELSADVVVAVATGREKELEQILSMVRDNLSAPVIQHIIVSAPRGYGKSFFLRYIQVRIEEIAKEEHLPIVMALLPEELPHVKEPDTLIAEIERTFLQRPADSVGVRWTEDDGSAWYKAIAELDRVVEEYFSDGRGFLVVGVENFDLLVKKVFAKHAPSGRLREFLTRPGNRVMLLAASARGAIDSDYDRPLFKVFEEIALQPWTIEQTVEFLIAQRKTVGKPPLTETQLAKAKAVAAYISGTPRLATLIGEALLEDDPLGAAEVLEKLVDELTPYYKERIEILPPRSQALLDALLRGGENCSSTELAKRVGAPSQSAIAAPLDDLKKDLVVVGEKAPDSAEILLRVADRVFAHYYRKRILSHGLESCPLEALVDILALIYSPEEKRREAEKFAARGLAREAAIMTRLWEADRKLGPPRVGREAVAADTEFDRIIAEWGRVNGELDYVGALSILDRAFVIARNHRNLDEEISVLKRTTWTLTKLERHNEALAVARETAARALDAENYREQVSALIEVAVILGILGQHDEALAAAREAATKAANISYIDAQLSALRVVTWNLGQLGRHEEALVTAREVAVKASSTEFRDADIALALASAAWSLVQLNRYDEAVAAARDAFEKAERAGGVEGHLSVAYVLLVARPPDTSLALKAYEWVLRSGESLRNQGPALFFNCVAHVATIQQDWPALIALLEAFPEVAEQITKKSFSLGEPGLVLSRMMFEGQRENGLTIARHFIAALARVIQGGSDNRLTRLWVAVLDASTDAVVSEVSDAKALREFAEILAAHSSIPARAVALSHAAAAYHAADRDRRTLARLAPDLATMLTTVFPPKSVTRKPKPKPRKKKQR